MGHYFDYWQFVPFASFCFCQYTFRSHLVSVFI